MTTIEWTEVSWNPIVGCSVTSPGCTNCYAMRQAARIERMNPGLDHYRGLTQSSKAGSVWTGKTALAPDHILTAPLRRKKPTMWFVNSMGDLFHPSVPDEWIDRVFAVMALCPQHVFQVLTKRAERMRGYLADEETRRRILAAYKAVETSGAALARQLTRLPVYPLPNVWLGISAEDQRRADERIPDLLATPAAIRFLSAEPLLSGLEILKYLYPLCDRCAPWETPCRVGCDRCTRLDWVIVGGESGPDAWPMHPDWARSIRDQCATAGVPFFFKQWGEWAPQEIWEERETAAGDYEFRFLPHTLFATNDGRILSPDDYSVSGAKSAEMIRRVGKRRAGRLLDGIEHNAMPEVRRG